jgi:hypothetical protein
MTAALKFGVLWHRSVTAATALKPSSTAANSHKLEVLTLHAILNRGFSAESPKATRSFRMAVFRPSSKPTSGAR